MKQRHVRMSGTHISARLDEQVFQVTNLSLSGALLQIDYGHPFDAGSIPAVDSQVKLVLLRRTVEVTLDAQVIRSDQSAHSSHWLVAVKFLNISRKARTDIPQLLSEGGRGER